MISGIGGINPLGTTGPGSANPLGGTATPGAVADAGSSFAAALADAAKNTVGTLQQAEHVSVQALQGKAEMRDVVDAVMSAEQALQAAVAIRDKIVSAYLEVSRMGI